MCTSSLTQILCNTLYTMPSLEFIKKNYCQEDVNRAVLRRTDSEYLIDFTDLVTAWFDEIKSAVKCKNKGEFSTEVFTKPSVTKLVIVWWLRFWKMFVNFSKNVGKTSCFWFSWATKRSSVWWNRLCFVKHFELARKWKALTDQDRSR